MRRLVALLLALVLALAGASAVMAASGWTLTLTPSTIAEGQKKVFKLQATNKDGADDIGCVKVTVPAGFTVQGAAVTGTSVGGGWQATEVPLSGGKTLVQVFGGAKLENGDSVSFTITATAVDPDNVVWKSHVTADEGCESPIHNQINYTVTVQAAATPPPTPAPTPPPTPAPTPPPTPAPTPPPTPRPTVAPTAPLIATPTPGPGATPIATTLLASPSPASTASPGLSPAPASPTASPSPLVVVAVGPTASDGTPGTSGINPSAIVVAFAEGLDTPGFGAVSLLGDGYAWLVPTFVAGVPGLLIVLIILIQLLGGVIWTPSIRRLRSDPERANAQPKPGF